MDIKTIEREAVSSAVIDFGIFNSEKNDYYIKGFLTGALWRINSVWHEPFEHPADGQYLTILRQGDQILSKSLLGKTVNIMARYTHRSPAKDTR